jgi:hypothetical protein
VTSNFQFHPLFLMSTTEPKLPNFSSLAPYTTLLILD